MIPRLLLCLSFPPPWSGEESLGLALKCGLEELKSPEFSFFYFDISNKHSNVQRGRLSLQNILAMSRLAFQFLEVLFKIRPHAVYIPMAQNRFGFAKYSFFVVVASLRGCRVFSLLGGGNFHLFCRGESGIFRKWISFVLSRMDRILVQGENLKRQFEGLVPPEKIRVIPLGVDCSPFQQKKEEKNPKQTINVLFVGALSKAKGIYDLLEVIPKVALRIPLIHFHLVGEILETERNILHIPQPENPREDLKSLLETLDMQSTVTWHGPLHGPEKIKLFHGADIFVHPSYSESFPFVLLEASACGLPLIATAVGANPEVYREGENVFYVEAGNVDQLADRICRLALDENLRKELGSRNRNLVMSQYTHLDFGKRMLKIFSEVFQEERKASDLRKSNATRGVTGV